MEMPIYRGERAFALRVVGAAPNPLHDGGRIHDA